MKLMTSNCLKWLGQKKMFGLSSSVYVDGFAIKKGRFYKRDHTNVFNDNNNKRLCCYFDLWILNIIFFPRGKEKREVPHFQSKQGRITIHLRWN